MSEKVIILDCETTGLADTDHVIDICIRVGLEDDAKVELWRVKPPIVIGEEVIKIHGITNEMVADCPGFGEVADDIAKLIEDADVLVGYNPDYDKSFLKREFAAAGREVKWPKVTICPRRLWDLYIKPPKRSLVNAFKEFVDPAGYDGAHGAIADVNATVRVLEAQREKFDLRGKKWSELDPDQDKQVGPSNHFTWKDSHKDRILISFGKHTGKEVSELDNGYLHYLIEKNFPYHVKAICNQLKKIRDQKIPNPPEAIAIWAKENL